MDEYVDRFALRDALYDADAITMQGVKIINQFPTAVDAATVRWIPVTERLPEDREDVMVSAVSDGKVMIGTGWYVVEKGRWYVRCITTCEQCPDITHWMPLPLPPEAALKGGEG